MKEYLLPREDKTYVNKRPLKIKVNREFPVGFTAEDLGSTL